MNTFFHETVKRDQAVRYEIHLPFKANIVKLRTNRKLAEIRLKTLLIQARKEQGMLDAIDKGIGELLKQGFIEVVETPELGEAAHYLPLLAVKKSGSTLDDLKVRLVNDASARSKNEAD